MQNVKNKQTIPILSSHLYLMHSNYFSVINCSVREGRDGFERQLMSKFRVSSFTWHLFVEVTAVAQCIQKTLREAGKCPAKKG